MKFGRRNIIIAVLVLTILFLVFFMGRRLSFADASPPAAAGGLSAAIQPNPAQLPSGSMLGKMVAEDCTKKYGAGWTRFTDTLCKKA